MKQSYPPMKDLPWWAKPTLQDTSYHDRRLAERMKEPPFAKAFRDAADDLRRAVTPRSPDSGRSDKEKQNG